MHRKFYKLVMWSFFLTFCLIPFSKAEQGDVQGILAVAKMTGACGVLDSMIQLQNTTKLEGGDEFVARFWSYEAARLGKTVEELSETCDRSINAYNKFWELTEKK